MSDSDDFFILSSDDEDDISLELLDDIENYNDLLNVQHMTAIGLTKIIMTLEYDHLINHLTAKSWNLDPNKPLSILLEIETDNYRNSFREPKSVVFQNDEKNSCYQLDLIAKQFVKQAWASQARFRYGFFQELKEYLLDRIPTLNKHCVLCDEIPTFINDGLTDAVTSMLKPFVCSKPLCYFRYQQFQMGVEFSTGIYGSHKIIHLMVIMMHRAVQSNRRDLILDPFPTLLDPNDQTNIVLSSENKDYDRLKEILQGIPTEELFYQNDRETIRRIMDDVNPYSFPLFQWIINSNRSSIFLIPPELRIKEMCTDEQHILVTDSPEKEAAFQEQKKKHGSVFAFHGSPLQNWHSIMRNGLFNASGTKHQMHGQAYGTGIYFNESSSYSRRYSNPKIRITDVDSNKACLALCEVIDHNIKKSGTIWTVQDPANVCTRFLFIYDNTDKTQKCPNVKSTSPAFMEKVNTVYQKMISL